MWTALQSTWLVGSDRGAAFPYLTSCLNLNAKASLWKSKLTHYPKNGDVKPLV
jgi:hypothetical protein